MSTEIQVLPFQVGKEPVELPPEPPKIPPDPDLLVYPFIGEMTLAMQSGRSRSLVLSGNVQDLFFSRNKDAKGKPSKGGKYVPLVNLLISKFTFQGTTRIGGEEVDLAILHLDLNDGIRFVGCEEKIVNMFVSWQVGLKNPDHLPPTEPETPRTRRTTNAPFTAQPILEATMGETLADRRKKIENTLYASIREARNVNSTGLQVLRRFVEASQATNGPKLLIIVEGADMVVPPGNGDLANLSASVVRKLAILEGWFSDPDFLEGKSTVVLLSDSLSAIHPRITRLPQLVNIDVPAPDEVSRLHFIDKFYADASKEPQTATIKLAQDTAGLSLHAIRQLLVEHVHLDVNKPITTDSVSRQLTQFIKAQLGDSIKFYRPHHAMNAVRGNRKLKQYAPDELIPRLLAKDESALPAVIAAGAIGVGKTFFLDAVAYDMDCPVLELGNIRSSLYGGTDIIIDKLERILRELPRALIYLPEADTVLGGVGKDVHETEKRVTGRFQALMSNPAFRGRISWILDTARVDQLSPDIRRPGRADLIIPFFDPDDTDRIDFVNMLLESVPTEQSSVENVRILMEKTKGYSAALFGAIRSRIKDRQNRDKLKDFNDLLWVVNDTLIPDIGNERRFAELQALLNCTSRFLLPDEYQAGDMDTYRKKWKSEIDFLLPTLRR